MTFEIKNRQIEIIFLSPVFVGNGEVASPMEYTIIDEELLYFNTTKVLNYLIEQKKISFNLLNTGKYREIRQIIYSEFQKNKKMLNFVEHKTAIASDNFFNDFQEITNKKSNKRFELEKMSYNSITSNYILPGSSIKGAIRTAIESFIADKKNLSKTLLYKKNAYREIYKKQISGGIEKDPFKNFVVSDLDIPKTEIAIVKPEEIKKNKRKEEKPSPPKNYVEAILPFYWLGKESPTSHFFSISLLEHLSFDTEKISSFDIEKISSFSRIREITTDFYKKVFDAEFEKFYKFRTEIEELEYLKSDIETYLNKGWGIMRLGHYSHAESMTLENYKKIIGRKFRNKNENIFGTTRTLAEKELPFGWIAFKER